MYVVRALLARRADQPGAVRLKRAGNGGGLPGSGIAEAPYLEESFYKPRPVAGPAVLAGTRAHPVCN
ncbi:hypothetical protein GCM10010277_69800 [Streptomyces longisporoflavus]|nr:hypothetical protein GCM10010277_69800 [Streptomyces longisporoflavus]